MINDVDLSVTRRCLPNVSNMKHCISAFNTVVHTLPRSLTFYEHQLVVCI